MSKHKLIEIKDLETYLNNNMSKISQFEISEYSFIIHMKNGDTIQIEGEVGDSGLIFDLYKHED